MTEVNELIEGKSIVQLMDELEFQINVNGEDPGGNIVGEIEHALMLKINAMNDMKKYQSRIRNLMKYREAELVCNNTMEAIEELFSSNPNAGAYV